MAEMWEWICMEDCEEIIVACSNGRRRHSTAGSEDDDDRVQKVRAISKPEPAWYDAECWVLARCTEDGKRYIREEGNTAIV